MGDSNSRVLPPLDRNGDCLSGSDEEPAYAEIIVIRHGETEWNAAKRLQGHLDVELNEVGRKQAAAVAHRLSREPKISVVYSSDLKRARDTAETIASCCGGLQVIEDRDLRERHLGDLQGLVHHEAAKICPQAYRAFSSSRTDQEIPGGGESLDQLYDRCTSALERIGCKRKGERVVVVTHGGVIRTLFERASPSGQPGRVLNTSVNIFHLSDGDIWTIKSWGDVSHLNQTEFLNSGFGGDQTSAVAEVSLDVPMLINVSPMAPRGPDLRTRTIEERDLKLKHYFAQNRQCVLGGHCLCKLGYLSLVTYFLVW